jgi:hypothetical protein
MTRMSFLPLLLAVGPTAVTAQQAPDARWLPWLGCWQAGQVAEPGVPLVCVRPASDPLGVEMVLVIGGAIGVSRHLVADGRPQDVTLDDCDGSQVTNFSTDGRRVYLRSTLTCEGGGRRTASAIMAMASPTEWLDVQSVGTDSGPVQRVLHYTPAPAARWPDEFLVSPAWGDRVMDARVLAASPLTLSDVREAATQVDRDALATFVLERKQRFALTAAGLEALDDAAVPDAVIDALVAVSYPGRFAVHREEARPVVPAATPPAPPSEPYLHPPGWMWWGYGTLGWWDYGMCFFSYCDSYRQAPADYEYRRHQAFTYGLSFSMGYVGRQTIVDRTVRPRGTALRGRGYTRGGQPAGTGSRGSYAQRRIGSAGNGTGSANYSSSGSGSGTGSASSGGYSRSGGSSSSSGSAKAKGRH